MPFVLSNSIDFIVDVVFIAVRDEIISTIISDTVLV